MSNHVYLEPRQLAEPDRYPFTIGQIKHYLNKRHINGLEKAVRKVGKRLYLRQDLFEDWIEEQSKRGRS